jgi:hypothetical protein
MNFPSRTSGCFQQDRQQKSPGPQPNISINTQSQIIKGNVIPAFSWKKTPHHHDITKEKTQTDKYSRCISPPSSSFSVPSSCSHLLPRLQNQRTCSAQRTSAWATAAARRADLETTPRSQDISAASWDRKMSRRSIVLTKSTPLMGLIPFDNVNGGCFGWLQ